MVTNKCYGCEKAFTSRQSRKYCEHACYSKSLVGRKLDVSVVEKIIAKNTGKKRTPEQKQRMSIAMTGKKKVVKHDKQFKKGQPSWIKGRKHSPEAIAKMKNNKNVHEGAEHWNWKGGISNPSKAERTKFRKKMQQLIFQRDNYTCQICEQHGGNLQVDHIKKWAEYPELRYEQDNCRTVCMACHYYITFKRKMPDGIVWGHNLSRRVTS